MPSPCDHPTLPMCPLLKPGEVRDYLRISKSTFYRMVDNGTIRALRVGTHLRIPHDEVLRVQRDYFE